MNAAALYTMSAVHVTGELYKALHAPADTDAFDECHALHNAAAYYAITHWWHSPPVQTADGGATAVYWTETTTYRITVTPAVRMAAAPAGRTEIRN